MKRVATFALLLALCVSLAGCGGTVEGGPVPLSAVSDPSDEEVRQAVDLGLLIAPVPDGTIPFDDCKALLDNLVTLCDPAAITAWNDSVSAEKFPRRDTRREDGLILLFLAAEALGYDVYNARELSMCTEFDADYQRMFDQLSWDYPYCDAEREVPLYSAPGVPDDPLLGSVPEAGMYWMQRRMDLSQWKHFLDHDEALDFHLNEHLTWKAAAAAALRLYNSEALGYNPYALGHGWRPTPQEPSEAQAAMLAEAEVRQREILDSPGALECTGTAYYVSNAGSDRNSGLSPQEAWATLDRVNEAVLLPGDGVYFQRGGLWRGQLWAQEGITYSAYGEGEKPRLYASPENGAGGEKWSLLEDTDNIWVYHIPLMDCGGVVFNEGESYGVKICPGYQDGFRSPADPAQPFDVKTELTEDLAFFSQADSILYNGAPLRMYTDGAEVEHRRYPEIPEPAGELYLRCDRGSPGEVFDSIEFATRQHIVVAADQSSFNNLSVKYGGAHGIYGYQADFDVSFCEIGWIGGTIQYYFYDTGEPVRFGNGVEAGGCFDRFSVTDCYIYQCWDAGVTNQDSADEPERTGLDDLQYEDAIHRNINYDRNVFSHTAMPVEIFFNLEDGAGFGRHYMENVRIAENYMLYTGYGWSVTDMRLHNVNRNAAYMGHWCSNTARNFVMENNVFYLSTGPLISTGALRDSLPLLRGNTYAQSENGLLARWTNEDGECVPYRFNADTARDIIGNILGDQTGVVLE